MKRFLAWFFDLYLSKDIEDREAMDQHIFSTFSGISGKNVLDYLIAQHYAFTTLPTMLDQCQFNEGRRFVVQDILDAMDRVQRAAMEVKVEA